MSEPEKTTLSDDLTGCITATTGLLALAAMIGFSGAFVWNLFRYGTVTHILDIIVCGIAFVLVATLDRDRVK